MLELKIEGDDMMTDKQTEFATYMFQEIYGKLTDEDGQPYVQVYQFEIEELIKDMLLI